MKCHASGGKFFKYENKVIDIEDLGRNVRGPKFTDEVLTLFIRGIKRKFKQPIAYYFTESGIKSPDLVVTICTVQSTGLYVLLLLIL